MKNVKMTASVLFIAFFCMIMVSGSFAATAPSCLFMKSK